MSEEAWFNEPMELFRADKIMKFWPTSEQDPAERINATSRFVIYAACMIYLIKRDARVFILAAMVLAVMFVLYKKNLVKVSSARPVASVTSSSGTETSSYCQRPTFDNPMGNVLLSDYIDNPNRPAACDSGTVSSQIKKVFTNNIPYDMGRSRSPWPQYQQNAASRQFVTAPVSNIPGDQTGFAEWLYGKKNAPSCRDDPSACNADIRGVQLESLSGLGTSGAPRIH
jgi:hypothetical protein